MVVALGVVGSTGPLSDRNAVGQRHQLLNGTCLGDPIAVRKRADHRLDCAMVRRWGTVRRTLRGETAQGHGQEHRLRRRRLGEDGDAAVVDGYGFGVDAAMLGKVRDGHHATLPRDCRDDGLGVRAAVERLRPVRDEGAQRRGRLGQPDDGPGPLRASTDPRRDVGPTAGQASGVGDQRLVRVAGDRHTVLGKF